jgi:hypothetical protein
MPSRFQPGAAAYAKNGRRYVVEEVQDGIVYCLSAGGAETEFAEAQLLNETEWAAQAGSRMDRLYGAIRQSKAYAPYSGKLNRTAADRLLAKADRLVAGILDYTAFVSAERALAASGDGAAAGELSIVKCREIFDTASPESRTSLLAGLIGSPPEVLVGAVDLGDNLLRAMIAKATTAGSMSFAEFGTRRRR